MEGGTVSVTAQPVEFLAGAAHKLVLLWPSAMALVQRERGG